MAFFGAVTKAQKYLFFIATFCIAMTGACYLVLMLSNEITPSQVGANIVAFLFFLLVTFLVTLGNAFVHLFRRAWRSLGVSVLLLAYEVAGIVFMSPVLFV